MAHVPGFALQVTVDRPDVQGRVRILKVHSRGKQIGKDVDFEKIARRTPGVCNPLSNTCVHDVFGAGSCCWPTCNAQMPDAFPSSICPLHTLLMRLPRHGVRADIMRSLLHFFIFWLCKA